MTSRLLITLLLLESLYIPAVVCAEESAEPDNTVKTKTVYFPQFQLFQTVKNETDLLYEITGKLVLQDECLRIASGEKEFLIIWPGWFDFNVRDREIVVRHIHTGVEIARLKIGDKVHFSGAELENNPVNLSYAIPEQCSGPYWAVGEIETTKTEKSIKAIKNQFNRDHVRTVKKTRQSINKNIKPQKGDNGTKDLSKELIQLEIKLEDSIVK